MPYEFAQRLKHGKHTVRLTVDEFVFINDELAEVSIDVLKFAVNFVVALRDVLNDSSDKWVVRTRIFKDWECQYVRTTWVDDEMHEFVYEFVTSNGMSTIFNLNERSEFVYSSGDQMRVADIGEIFGLISLINKYAAMLNPSYQGASIQIQNIAISNMSDFNFDLPFPACNCQQPT